MDQSLSAAQSEVSAAIVGGPAQSELAEPNKHASTPLSRASVLVVDDEPGIRNFLSKTLSGVCARVDLAEDTFSASTALDEHTYDIVLLDNVMPKRLGIDWLTEQKQIGLFSDAILMTAHADLETAIAALRAGASDFLLKPFRSKQVVNAIDKCLQRANLRRQNSLLRHELESGSDLLRQRSALLGNSEKIEAVRQAVTRAAAVDARVVFRGEVGSGTQIAARMLHSKSARHDRPFVWLQCHGLEADKLRGRLFGSLDDDGKGQRDAQDGLLMDGAGGTLFLEDVDALSPSCQTCLVEVLTSGQFRPLGAERSRALDINIVSSSTKALAAQVDAGSFRSDLFYLLNVVEIALPPLRERSEDIEPLMTFFIDSLSKRMGVEPPVISATTRRRLLAHDWPGNVMELRNAVERGLISGSFEAMLGGSAIEIPGETLADVEKRHILSVLEACGGNRAEAARRLDVARKTIDRKCQAWGV